MDTYIGPELSPSERLAVDAILKNYPEGHVKLVKAFHSADFTDSEDVPGGTLIVHPVGSKVHIDSIPLNAFSYLAIVPIKPMKDYTDADFTSKKDLLHEAVSQYSDTPPSLRCKNVSSNIPGSDGRNWTCELGEDSEAFAGVFKQTKGRDTKYYIAVQAGAPMACKQLREKIAKTPMTFEELISDKDYSYAHYIAQRNVERIAYNVARAFKVSVNQQLDVGSKREYEFSGLPMRVIPLFMQATSTIVPIVHESEHSIGVFSKLTPVSNAANINFVYEGPYNGIAVFNMNKRSIGHALPSASGKLANPVKLTESEISKRIQNVICEGNIKKHPDIVADTFRPVDNDEFLDSFVELGWKRENVQNLVPVAVKIFDPSIKRK